MAFGRRRFRGDTKKAEVIALNDDSFRRFFLFLVVGGTGFEPVTPSMSTKCATTAPTAPDERAIVYQRVTAKSILFEQRSGCNFV